MAWTDPATYTTSEVVTATKLNTHLRDNMKELWHEVAYTEFTASVSVGTSQIDIVSSGAITYAAFPIFIEFFTPQVTTFSTGAATLSFVLVDASLSLNLGQIAASVESGSGTVGSFGGGTVARRLTPTAATHTYKIQAVCSAGTVTVAGGAGGAGNNVPGFIRIMAKGS